MDSRKRLGQLRTFSLFVQGVNMLNVKDIADVFKVSVSQVRVAIKRAGIDPSSRSGNTRRYDSAAMTVIAVYLGLNPTDYYA